MTRLQRPSVLVDARALGKSGIGRYLREILVPLLADERFGALTLLGEPAGLHAFVEQHTAGAADSADRVRVRAYPGGFYSPRTQLAWATQLARGGARADVCFFPHYDAPFFRLPAASVVAVQDLTHFRVPAAFPAWKRAAAGVLFDAVVRGAARLLVSSASTCADLVQRVPSAGDRVDIIPLGVSTDFRPCAAVGCESCAEARAIGPYLLCVGNRKPHKNLGAAVEALAQLLPDWAALRLVVAGHRFEQRDEVDARAHALGVSHAVIERDGVDDDRLRCLYTHAEALIFPSLYEGFGLPVLEAMACGVPVIASNRASLPEVVGTAGLLIDPDDPDGISAAVRRLRSEPGLRSTLVQRGLARAAGFRWGRTAARTCDVLYRVATLQNGASRAGPPRRAASLSMRS